jgi:hypothetical protein
MGPVTWIGVAMTAAGLALLARVILRARKLRGETADATDTRATLNALVAMNFAAVALAFLGLGVVLVGLLIAR